MDNGRTRTDRWTRRAFGALAVPGAIAMVATIGLGLAGCGSKHDGSEPIATDGGTKSVLSQEYGSQAGEVKTITLPGGATMEMVWCPAGTFMMGSSEEEERRFPEETQRRVTLRQGFWMAKTEVTQRQWKSVMGDNPSDHRGDDLPVEMVSWDDAEEFCQKAGLRLPTEAEWEYACRAGSTGPYAGNGKPDKMGWYEDNSGNTTHPVGKKRPNAWGLYDMHGNVNEWCADWYGEYSSGAVTDPKGPASGRSRVLRSGCAWNPPHFCRSASRDGSPPDFPLENYGFRPVLSETKSAVDRECGPQAGEVKTITLRGGSTMQMVWCPPGKFKMGSPEGEYGWYLDEIQHEVTLTEGFWIAANEVTQTQWESVMGTTMEDLKELNIGHEWDIDTIGNASMGYVTLRDCQEFCRKAGNGLQLPTDAQWEYACRAGSAKNDDSGEMPNHWGLFDMHGSVWEWCADGYREDLGKDAVTNPIYNPASSSQHVVRGHRTAERLSFMPEARTRLLGFRPVSMSLSVEAPEVATIIAATLGTGNEAGETKAITLGEGVTMEMVWCPAGSFTMGSPRDEVGRNDERDEETQHQVTLTKGFWMAKTEVTQEQWESVMGSNPSEHKGDDLPVEMVSCDDAQEFCRKAGLELPTEAEWEYACRAGSTGPYAGDGKLDEMGWYSGNSGDKTHPVGQKKANAWGLQDMHGNVNEWCADWHDSWYYRESPPTDPKGPISGKARVLRGGCYYENLQGCRSAARVWADPGSLGGDRDIGFRPVFRQD